MALELRQQLKLTQQLIMTPQLQMAIKLLQLSRLELLDTIRQEMEENPALEEIIEHAEEPAAETKEVSQEEIPLNSSEMPDDGKVREDIDWSNYIDEYNSPGRLNLEYEKKDAPAYESFIARKESLEDHLLWQLLMTTPSEEEERIGSFIIGNLNRDGYLDLSVEDIAEASGSSPEKVLIILRMMQAFDPVGVCARNLSECLMIQARQLGIDQPIVGEIIANHLGLVEKKHYKAIAKALDIGIEEVVSAVNLIKTLEPRPGRQFSDEEPQYIIPDIYIYKMENEFVILLNDDGLPKLRVSQFYREAMSHTQSVSDTAKHYIQDKLSSATWLIRSIHQRQKTIYRVTQSILKYQHAFFEKGVHHLKPMVLRDVAQDIGMHESTVSRVTTNKYVYTPQGIFELKYFFNSSISRVVGEAIASASVQEKIKKIIDSEDPKKPHSDNKIAAILKKDNINIARRTVAKYRELMRILPSNRRKDF